MLRFLPFPSRDVFSLTDPHLVYIRSDVYKWYLHLDLRPQHSKPKHYISDGHLWGVHVPELTHLKNSNHKFKLLCYYRFVRRFQEYCYLWTVLQL